MHNLTLYYIDRDYALPFNIKHEIYPLHNGKVNGLELKKVVLDTIGSFGKGMDVPVIFMDEMIKEDFDRLLIKIAYKPESLLLRFFLKLPDRSKVLFASHEDGSLYRLFALNEIFSAIKPLNNVAQDKEEIVWARHEALASKYTKIA